MRSVNNCAMVRMLRRSWLTLATAAPKLRQPFLLLQRARQLGLHRLQRIFGVAQFRHAGRGLMIRRASSGASA